MSQETGTGGQQGREFARAGTLPPPPLPPPFARPALELGYAMPGVGRPAADDVRPGRLTTLGILSIILGTLGILLNGLASLGWLGGYMSFRSQLYANDRRATIVPAPADLVPYKGEVVGPRGLDRAARQAARAAIEARGSRLSDDHPAMLDRLLAEAGRDVFGGSDAAALIGRVGAVEADRAGVQSCRIRTAAGVIEVDRTNAAWTPAGAAVPAVLVTRNIVSEVGRADRFAAVAVTEALEVERNRAGGKLNALQAAVILRELESWVPEPRKDRQFEAVPIRIGGATHGTIRFMLGDRPFSGGNRGLWIFVDGRTADQAKARFEPDPATGRPVETAPTGASRYRAQTAVVDILLLACFESALSFVLACLLVVAGIRVFTESPAAISTHTAYAALKMVALAMSAVVTGWFVVNAGWPMATLGRGVPRMISAQATLVATVLIQLAYPTVVLAVLANGDVRRYAAARGWGYGALSRRAWRTLWNALDGREGRRLLAGTACAALALAAAHWWCAAAGPGDGRALHRIGMTGAIVAGVACATRAVWPRFGGAATARAVAGSVLIVIGLAAGGRVAAQDGGAGPASRPSQAPIILRLGNPHGPTAGARRPIIVPFAPPVEAGAPGAQSVDALIAQAAGTDVPARFRAVRDLYSAGERGHAALFGLIGRAPLPLRGSVLSAMAQSWDLRRLTLGPVSRPAATEAAPALAELLATPSSQGKDGAIALVERIGACPQTLDACVTLLQDGWAGNRRRGGAVVRAGDPAVIAAAVDRLAHQIDESAPVNPYANPQAERAVRGLAELGPAAVPALLRATRATWSGVRLAALTGLETAAPSPELTARLGELLADREPGVRTRAAAQLARVGGAEGRDVLIDQVFDHYECQQALATVLPAVQKWVGHATSEPRNREPAVRDVVRRALHAGNSGGDPEAQLLAALDDPSPAAQRWAARALLDSDWLRRAGAVEQARVIALANVRSPVRMSSGSSIATPAALPRLAPVGSYGPWSMPTREELAAAAERAETPLGPVAWFVTFGVLGISVYLFVQLARDAARGRIGAARARVAGTSRPTGGGRTLAA